MLNLTTIDMLLSINEMEIIEEIVLTLLATPQLVTSFAPIKKRSIFKFNSA
ncbi:hypothetical protein [Arsenophonus sp. PmNCSU2021_1]|uniref:hypothetical protein n=1 Tax=Arsenophonus sp. PmNCSU2021_1 TaxID=3118989 RepID=UPI002FF40353